MADSRNNPSVAPSAYWAEPVSGVVISPASAQDIVGLIDELALRSGPKALNSRIVRLRHRLIECCTRVNTSFDASTEVVGGEDLLTLNPDAVINPVTAAGRLNKTPDGVRWLCKNGHLAASKINGHWWIEAASVELYKQSKGSQNEA